MSFQTVTMTLLDGFLLNIELFAVTLVLSLPLGLVVSFGTMSRFKPLCWLTRFYVYIMRSTPLMLQLAIVYYLPGIAFGPQYNLPKMTAAALASGLPGPNPAALALRDGDMRKLLIRKGASYEAKGPVFVEVPWELIHGEEITVEVTVLNTGGRTKEKQLFTLNGKATKEQMKLTRKD